MRAIRRVQAFSLVELLVVIGIVGLLIALLLPMLTTTQARARQLKCLAVLRAIGQAAKLHEMDHHGFLPAAGHHWDLTGGRLDPQGLDDPPAVRYTYYLDNGMRRPAPVTAAFAMAMGMTLHTDSREAMAQELLRGDLRARFECPAQEHVMRGLSQIGPGWSSPPEYSSYIFNEAVLGRREVRPDRSPAIQGNVVKVKHPADVFLAADGRPRGVIDGEAIMIPNAGDHDTLASFIELTTWGPDAARGHMDYTRHGYRINVLFLDGHAQSVLMTGAGLATIGVSQGIYE